VRFTQEEGPDVDFVGSTFQIEGDVGVSIGVEGKQPWGVGKGHSGEIVLIAVKAKIPGEDGLFENQFVLHHFEDHMLAYYADSINKFWTPLNADDGLPDIMAILFQCFRMSE